MQERLTIVKVGGKVVENPETLTSFINDFSNIAGKKILYSFVIINSLTKITY